MKLLKLIPVAAIVLTAFTTFEATVGYPRGLTKNNSCKNLIFGRTYYKLQKTDPPAAYGVYGDHENDWVSDGDVEAVYVSYKCATQFYKDVCDDMDFNTSFECKDFM